MAKKVKEEKSNKAKAGVPLIKSAAEIDPALASLFATSAAPAKKSRSNSATNDTSKLHAKKSVPQTPDEDSVSVSGSEEEDSGSEQDDETLSSISEQISDHEDGSTNGVPLETEAAPADRKRKRRRDEDDIEGQYMERIAREEAKEEAKLREERKSKRQKASSDSDGAPDEDTSMGEDEVEDGDSDDEDDTMEPGFEIPQHETLAGPEGSAEFEKANRTVFLGNVSSQAMTSKSAKKTLLRHLGSFLTSLPAHTPPHTVESIRFRSTAYSNKIPKKAAFAKKELMDATTKSTNAYAVYSSKTAAREAARVLNGTVVLDRHLRVDEVAHPAKTDARRCVFVGNLGFVDDESAIQAAEAEDSGRKPRKREPGDVEEGLWREFGKVGVVESVRVVRDPKTRVGKGFAYVQFKDENTVEAALHHNDKRFPPLLPRKLRVVRAKTIKRNAASNQQNRGPGSRGPQNGVYNRKVTTQEKTLHGRASKLLGRAGAAHVKRDDGAFGASRGAGSGANAVTVVRGAGVGGNIKGPESFVFEGYRASSKQGTHGLKLGGSGKKGGGKPRNRSAKRGSAWKAGGGKKK